jgi:hypothetical protein
MSDTGSSTRIVDLPDANSGKLPQYTQSAFGGYGANSNDMGPTGASAPMNGYIQMNVHPNPYGNMSPQTNMIPLPQQTSNHKPNAMNPYLGGVPPSSDGAPQFALPSRDIPQDTTSYVQDESIKANYIPPSTRSGLGLGEEEDEYLPKPVKGMREKYGEGKKKVRFADDWMLEWQRPILIAMMFFLFQMPMLNVLMMKYLKALKLFSEDGNMNYMGFVLKSVIFGLGVYGIERM